MTLRCTECRYSHSDILPDVDKTVIYLDQFVFSSIFKIRAGGKPPLGQHEFYEKVEPLLQRVVLLQQAILPHSDLHQNETTVFHDAAGLREAYEGLGGDVSLKGSREIELEQVFAFARAYCDGTEPILKLEPDAIIEGKRNVWLPDMRIAVNTDYSQFADGIREERDRGFSELKGLVAAWAENKPSFADLLGREQNFGLIRRNALAQLMERFAIANSQGDGWAILTTSMEPLWREYRLLLDIFRKGLTEEEAVKRVFAFWDWRQNREMPYGKISAYLFAAFGRRIGMGQRKFTKGLMTDIQALAAYAPYVDAMFVDKECASLLGEAPLSDELQYRARIFSYANASEFLDYLNELEQRATGDIRGYANRIYGLR